jgi:hypothetical protein
VEVYLFDRCAVDVSFGFRKTCEDGEGAILDVLIECARVQDFGDIAQVAMDVTFLAEMPCLATV